MVALQMLRPCNSALVLAIFDLRNLDSREISIWIARMSKFLSPRKHAVVVQMIMFFFPPSCFSVSNLFVFDTILQSSWAIHVSQWSGGIRNFASIWFASSVSPPRFDSRGRQIPWALLRRKIANERKSCLEFSSVYPFFLWSRF